MCDKAVDNYAYALEIVSDYYNAQKCVIQPSILILLQFDFFLNAIRLLKFMVKLLYLFFFVFHFVPDQYNTQEIYDGVVSKLILYCLDEY